MKLAAGFLVSHTPEYTRNEQENFSLLAVSGFWKSAKRDFELLLHSGGPNNSVAQDISKMAISHSSLEMYEAIP